MQSIRNCDKTIWVFWDPSLPTPEMRLDLRCPRPPLISSNLPPLSFICSGLGCFNSGITLLFAQVSGGPSGSQTRLWRAALRIYCPDPISEGSAGRRGSGRVWRGMEEESATDSCGAQAGVGGGPMPLVVPPPDVFIIPALCNQADLRAGGPTSRSRQVCFGFDHGGRTTCPRSLFP